MLSKLFKEKMMGYKKRKAAQKAVRKQENLERRLFDVEAWETVSPGWLRSLATHEDWLSVSVSVHSVWRL